MILPLSKASCTNGTAFWLQGESQRLPPISTLKRHNLSAYSRKNSRARFWNLRWNEQASDVGATLCTSYFISPPGITPTWRAVERKAPPQSVYSFNMINNTLFHRYFFTLITLQQVYKWTELEDLDKSHCSTSCRINSACFLLISLKAFPADFRRYSLCVPCASDRAIATDGFFEVWTTCPNPQPFGYSTDNIRIFVIYPLFDER